MAIDEEADDAGGGIPEWVVTFGDMMSLLLTFFIMLVSLSEIKEEEKYQAMVESVRRKFGHDLSTAAIVPGDTKPRNSKLSKLATLGRSQKFKLMKGGSKVLAPVGDHKRVRVVRMGNRSTIGTVMYFDETSATLTEKHKRALQREVMVIGGKPQKIEIRGHTSRRPASDAGFQDNWELAYQRSRAALRYLVDELQIDPGRIRLSVAGPYEPIHIGTDKDKLRLNPRVEIFILDEVVTDLLGTEDERKTRMVETGP